MEARNTGTEPCSAVNLVGVSAVPTEPKEQSHELGILHLRQFFELLDRWDRENQDEPNAEAKEDYENH